MIKFAMKWMASGLVTVLGGVLLAALASTVSLAANSQTHSMLQGGMPQTSTNRLHAVNILLRPIATGLAQTSGELQGFADNTNKLLHNFTFSTVAAESDLGHARPQRLAQAGSIVTLESPRIDDYWMSATRQPGGVVVFDGYAPDEATRQRLSDVQGADINFLKLGRGAPQHYQAAVDFGLALLQRLNEGRFALRGNIVTMTGIARSSADYAALAALIATGAPQGLVLAKSEISAPAAAPYLWSATKSSDGAIALSGMVPDLAAKATLAGAKGHPAVAALSYASGEPGGFLASATTALDLLQFLDIGSASYDGTGWAIAGEAASASEKAAIEASFATYKLAAAGWAFDVSVVAAPAPMAPYTWSATRSADGAIALAGHVPTQGMKNFLAIYAGNAITDTTAVTDGAPEGFVGQVRAALDAVLALDSGAAQFDGNTWTLSGQAASAAVRDSVLTGLGTFAKDWTVAIATPAVVEPAAVPDVQPEAPDTIEPAVPEKPAVTAPTVDPAYRFSATRGAGRAVTMSGNLPAEPALRFFGVITGAPTTGVTIAAGAPDGFVLSAETGIRGLMVLQAGELAFANGKLSLSGTAATDADRDALTASIAALSSGAAWTVAIATPPPLMACQTKVVEFSAANAILFQSGAAIIATESQPALDALAGYLALCPNADVDIEGHTDADGDDQLNLALSVARAEAVIAALVSRHVAASRLYAVGYGESQPIADNTTAAGKRLNRRIVVKVQEHHQD